MNILNFGRGTDISSTRTDWIEGLIIEKIRLRNKQRERLTILELGPGIGALIKNIDPEQNDVYAIDLEKKPDDLSEKLIWIQNDFLTLPNIHNLNLIVAQRCLHYLPYTDCNKLLLKISKNSERNATLCGTVSSIYSEHGEMYSDLNKIQKDRYCKLSIENQEKHQMYEPVCLYDENGLSDILLDSNWEPLIITLSTFGNLKFIARKK